MAATYEELRTVEQLVDETPWMTKDMLRWYLFNRDTNGLNKAVFKISRKILIDRLEFARWVDSHRVVPTQH